MKRHLHVMVLACALPLCGFAANIPIYNTGQNTDGSLATAGAADPNYTSASTVFVEASPAGAWVTPDLAAQWIGPDAGDGGTFGGGVYSLDYQISFDLTGLDASTASISGRWGTDNTGTDIEINGVSTGQTSAGFGALTGFSIASGFTAGVNTLDFLWANSGGPGGLLVEIDSATANVAPEPAAIILTGMGMLGLGILRRKTSR